MRTPGTSGEQRTQLHGASPRGAARRERQDRDADQASARQSDCSDPGRCTDLATLRRNLSEAAQTARGRAGGVDGAADVVR